MRKGIIFALITALISGFSIFYNKLIIVKGIDPLVFNIVKNGGTAFILSLLLLHVPKVNKLKSLSINQWKKLLIIGAVGGSVPFILYFEGLRTVSAANANLIHKTLFLWVAAMAVPILGEKLNIWQIAGYLLVAWSNLFIGGLSGFSGSIGEYMILAATIFWGMENIIAKIALKDIDSHIVAWGRMFIGSLILVSVAFFENKLSLITKLSANQILPILGSILLLCGYVITWYKALKFAPATVVASVLILSTPITNVLTAIFINHAFLPQPQFINLIFTILGLTFIIRFLPALILKWT
ncbi:DMT family transporter [Candidatus Gottesmanbacteria bacterium]|nr:DMT family transporter [Candidatus Gottesmanbacteria bacterium]